MVCVSETTNIKAGGKKNEFPLKWTLNFLMNYDLQFWLPVHRIMTNTWFLYPPHLQYKWLFAFKIKVFTKMRMLVLSFRPELWQITYTSGFLTSEIFNFGLSFPWIHHFIAHLILKYVEFLTLDKFIELSLGFFKNEMGTWICTSAG